METPLYESLGEVEHILRRPGMYTGAVAERVQAARWVLCDGRFRYGEYNMSLLAIKAFDEILMNAVDNATRKGAACSGISVHIHEDARMVSVMNDGCAIPLGENVDGKSFVEMLFGQLRTSSNYSDDGERISAGQNGLGSKLTNVFSVSFIVELQQNGVCGKFVFRENMRRAPEVTTCAGKEGGDGVLTVSYKLDPEIVPPSVDERKLMEKMVIDCKQIVGEGVSVMMNEVEVTTVAGAYAELYVPGYPGVMDTFSDANTTCFLTLSEEAHVVSFVNGVSTLHNGHHVDCFVKPFCEFLVKNTKGSTMAMAQKFCSQQIFLLIQTMVAGAVFASQDKSKLASSNCEKFKFLKCHSPVLSKYELGFAEFVRQKQNAVLKRDDGKRSRRVAVDKLDDAEMAGTRHGWRCTLILTEGDSAKTFAISGLSVIGREHFGVFPLKGKMLNVREATPSKIADNAEIKNLKKIMGLKAGEKYDTGEKLGTLRYGRIMVLTDADVDGHHIKGLFINAIDALWPELVMTPGFLCFMKTPLVKVRQNGAMYEFFSSRDYDQWKAVHVGGVAKYFKGLGTSSRNEACDYFRRMDELLVVFDPDVEGVMDMRRMFEKSSVQTRKAWIKSHIQAPLCIQYPSPGELYSLKSFVRRELICFSAADVARSIPSLVDGLKVSQRKILYALHSQPESRKTDEIKVAQLAGMTAQATNYHHGENSLSEAIIGMAQDYVGSNNAPLLEPIGQFGSRLMGGKDASSVRYIFTRLSQFGKHLVLTRHNPLLKHEDEDGMRVEPSFFLPILPTILVNGSRGIGTGYSTFIPPHDPRLLLETLRGWLSAKITDPSAQGPFVDLVPYYRGFAGRVVKKEGGYECNGVLTSTSISEYRVTELPVGCWTDDFKAHLENLLSEKKIESYVNGSTDVSVDFLFTSYEADISKMTKLCAKFSTQNMYAFNSCGELRRYGSASEMLCEWYVYRLKRYGELYDIVGMEKLRSLQTIKETFNFISLVLDRGIGFLRRKTEAVQDDLRALGFETREGTYAHLLDTRAKAFAEENLARLCEKIDQTEKEIERHQAIDKFEMWKTDLDSLEPHLPSLK